MNTTQITPYLFFDGQCEEAIDFYEKELGAKRAMLMRYEDSPAPPPPGAVQPVSDKKVMHASLMIDDVLVMMSDECSGAKVDHSGCRLAMGVHDEAKAKQVFNALSQGGRIEMPLSKTFWAVCFGMVTDKFGIGWMIMVRDSQVQGPA